MPECGCGTCGPTWARRRGKAWRFTEPVTLVAALELEDAAARPGMVEQQRTCLAGMVCGADGEQAYGHHSHPCLGSGSGTCGTADQSM